MSKLLRANLSPLSIFKKINGNLLVPIKFIVPQIPAWPSQFHNIKLGRVVDKLRADIKKNKLTSYDLTELATIGFIPDVRKYQSERALLGFQEYKRIKGDCNLQQNYVIPESKEWPKVLHGLKLGWIQSGMRQDINRYKSIRDTVAGLGFNLIPTENNGADFSRTYSALVAYKAIHGDVKIVRGFAVPHGDVRYPENTWGIKLGINLFSIRCDGAWSEHRTQLEALGVNYEVKQVRNEPFDVIYCALESYKAVHGNVKIVFNFVVPHGDALYPENTWGLKLGFIVSNIRNRGSYAMHRDKLQLLGLTVASKASNRTTTTGEGVSDSSVDLKVTMDKTRRKLKL